MENNNKKCGKRFEIIILHVKRNHEGTVKELIALQDYFKSKGSSYSFLQASYGTPAKALKKTIAWYLGTKDDDGYNMLQHPRKTLYEINKMFIDKKAVASGDVVDMGVQADVEKLIKGIAKFFGAHHKESEDLEEQEEPI